MQKGMLLCFLLLALFSTAQDIDVLHYKYELTLSDESDTIYGKAEIRFVMKKAKPLAFDLKELSADGKGMLVTKVNVNDHSTSSHAFAQQNSKLIIPVVKGTDGDTLVVRVHYKGIPDDGLIISKNKYGERTFFADNWPNRAHHWIPCIDKPDDKASVEFLVTAPAHYAVVSNGVKVTDRLQVNGNKLTHWREDIALPTKVMVIGAARFSVKTFGNSPDSIPISAWVYPQDSTKGFYDYALTPEIARFFSSYIAPYPYRKLANVQSTTIFGGMENASCIFYAENSVTGDRRSEDLMAHEIAHQWFGDMASEKSFAHLWLSEGFATYFTNLYWEHKYGKEAMRKRLQNDRQEVIQFGRSSSRAVVDSTENLMSLLNANSYQKGGWILHMLRQEVGDALFQKIIQAYYHQYKGGNAETGDFQAMAEKVSGKDLKGFFDQWLYRPGIPRLSFRKTITNEGLQLTIEQQQKDTYKFTLPVSIQAASEKERTKRFSISERTETFFLSTDKSAEIIVDPEYTLLFEEAKK